MHLGRSSPLDVAATEEDPLDMVPGLVAALGQSAMVV